MKSPEELLYFQKESLSVKSLTGTGIYYTRYFVAVMLNLIACTGIIFAVLFDCITETWLFGAGFALLVVVFLLQRWRRLSDKAVYNKYGEHYGWKEGRLTRLRLSQLRKDKLISHLGEATKNENYMSKLLVYVKQEMEDNKRVVNINNIPFIGLIGVAVGINIQGYIVSGKNSGFTFLALLVLIVTVYGGSKQAEQFMNGKHNELKDLYKLLQGIELQQIKKPR